jgi:hypothetical protein
MVVLSRSPADHLLRNWPAANLNLFQGSNGPVSLPDRAPGEASQVASCRTGRASGMFLIIALAIFMAMQGSTVANIDFITTSRGARSAAALIMLGPDGLGRRRHDGVPMT